MATEAQRNAQHHNYCIFLIKGQLAQGHSLQEHVSQPLLDELSSVQNKILEELRLFNHRRYTNSKGIQHHVSP